METQLIADLQAANARITDALDGHSESVLQAALAIDMQARGWSVQREIVVPIQYTPPGSRGYTVGFVRLDLVVSSNDGTINLVVELKKSAGGNHDQQLRKYASAIAHAWGVALFAPGLVSVLRHPNSVAV